MKKVIVLLVMMLIVTPAFAAEINLKDVPEVLVTKAPNDVVGRKTLKDDIGNTVIVEEIQYAWGNIISRMAVLDIEIKNLKDPDRTAKEIDKKEKEKARLQKIKDKIEESIQ